jgi:hypothetical protein
MSTGAGNPLNGMSQFAAPLASLNVSNAGPAQLLPGFEPFQTMSPVMTTWAFAFDGPSRFYLADTRLQPAGFLDRYDFVASTGRWYRASGFGPVPWGSPASDAVLCLAGRTEGGEFALYGASGSRHENHFASLCFGYLEQTKPGCSSRHPDDAEPMLVRHAQIGQLHGRHSGRRGLASAKDDRVAPASHVQYLCSHGELCVIAFGHSANGAARHGFAQHERICIAFCVIHAPTHIWVNRQPAIGYAKLVRAKRRVWMFNNRKITAVRKPNRAASQCPCAHYRFSPFGFSSAAFAAAFLKTGRPATHVSLTKALRNSLGLASKGSTSIKMKSA